MFTLVYAAQGLEVDIVLCAGEVVMDDDQVESFDESVKPILDRATATAADLTEWTGIQ